MFIGHFAPALALASHRKAPSLPVLFVGGQLIDWGFFTLLLLGIEKMRITPGITKMVPLDLYFMPYTHSLLASCLWAAAFGMLIALFSKNTVGALIGSAVVMSHWFLDLLVHAKDLTLLGSPPKLGFGLWNHPLIEIPLELILTFGALFYYARRTTGMKLPIMALACALLVFQAINWFGPVEPKVTAATSVLALFAYGVTALTAWWVGRGRVIKV